MADKKQEVESLPNIGAPATRALASEGYTNLKQLTKVSEAELSQLHGVGPKAIRILRDALHARGWSFKPGGSGKRLKKKPSPVSRTDKVDEFLQDLNHPLTAEVEVVRAIIKGAHPEIVEEVKWKAPSFSYHGEYLVTFNLWETQRIHLVFHNPKIPQVKSDLLEGDYKDRRMTYFANMKDVKANKADLEKVVKRLITLIES